MPQGALGEGALSDALSTELGKWSKLSYSLFQWVKGNNPVINKGVGADFDADSAANPAVQSFIGYGYRVLYGGQNVAVTKGGLTVVRIGVALKDMTVVSPVWVKAGINPIITESVGSVNWDSLRTDLPCFFYDIADGMWKYWYSGAPVSVVLPTGVVTDYIGIGYASSASAPEVAAPVKSVNNPVITRAMVATALGVNVATSIGAVLAPWVKRDTDGMYHMWFGVQIGPSFRYRVLYATSMSPDSGWSIYAPAVFSFGYSGSWFNKESGVLRPERMGDLWVAVFDGADSVTNCTQTGLAFSVDGIYWVALPYPIIPLGDEGTSDSHYSSIASICPLISREGYGFYMLYWGNDKTTSSISEAFCITSKYLLRQIPHNAVVLNSAVANTSRRIFVAPYLKKTLIIKATKTLAPGDLTVSVQIADEDVDASYITPSGFSKTFSTTGSDMIEWETHSTWSRIVIQAASGNIANYWTVTTKMVGADRFET